MRIAMVSEHASPLACLGGVDAGGQNVYVAAAATALARQGHSVTVYTRADREHLPGRVGFAPGVDVRHVIAGPQRELPKDELLPHMVDFAAALERHWSRERPDVVHANFWMSGLASTAAAADLDIPVVQTFHALGSVKRRWQGEADTSPKHRIDQEADLAGRVQRIVATCSDEVTELRRMGVVHDRIDVVPCGVDTDLFVPAQRRRRSASGSPRQLLVVGRLVPRKGVADAILALRSIPHANLVVAGGPEAGTLDQDPEIQRLRHIAAAAGVSERVSMLGRVTHRDLPKLIRSVDLVLAVPWYEPFGIVPLEAMACGTPVVGSAVGGLTDTIVDGVTGLLVPPRDPAAIAAAVNELLSDEPRRAAMAVAGRHRTAVRYSWDSVADRLLRSYRAAISDRSLTTAERTHR